MLKRILTISLIVLFGCSGRYYELVAKVPVPLQWNKSMDGKKPYVTVAPASFQEHATAMTWLYGTVDIVITVHNPTYEYVDRVLHCAGDPETYYVSIGPRDEWRGLGRVMFKDLHAEPCWLER